MAKNATKQTVAPEPPSVLGADPENPKLTRPLVERLLWINEERRRLDREARRLADEERLLRDVAFSWLEDRGVTTIKKFGVRVSQVLGRVIVPWKDAFIRECGQSAANALTEASPKSVSLKIARED